MHLSVNDKLKTSVPDAIFQEAKSLLKALIGTPSFSKEESATADIIEKFLHSKGLAPKRDLNNIWCTHSSFIDGRPTLLLNSHHDTVKPNAGYANDPFLPKEEAGKLYGLGSNDAGGPLVSLITVFCLLTLQKDLPFNLMLAATAEEEISGHNGVEYLLPKMPHVDCAIVGEPTLMNMAIAEKGLMVVDCTSRGKAGHAARNEGVNAIYTAMKDINWFQSHVFEKSSDLLGDVHMAVTSIDSPNKAHNVVPAECNFIVDIRVNELYSFDELLSIIKENVHCQLKPRSTRLQPSSISGQHPLVQAGLQMNMETYGSPTCSDQALMNFPSLKIGPGDSARSHMADEFIYVKEIEQGIMGYFQLLNNYATILNTPA